MFGIKEGKEMKKSMRKEMFDEIRWNINASYDNIEYHSKGLRVISWLHFLYGCSAGMACILLLPSFPALSTIWKIGLGLPALLSLLDLLIVRELGEEPGFTFRVIVAAIITFFTAPFVAIRVFKRYKEKERNKIESEISQTKLNSQAIETEQEKKNAIEPSKEQHDEKKTNTEEDTINKVCELLKEIDSIQDDEKEEMLLNLKKILLKIKDKNQQSTSNDYTKKRKK